MIVFSAGGLSKASCKKCCPEKFSCIKLSCEREGKSPDFRLSDIVGLSLVDYSVDVS